MKLSFTRSLLAAATTAVAFHALPAAAADITGAGSSFAYPIYAKWADSYKKQSGTGLNYQSIGSGGGIKQITAKTVDFGASDMPLKMDQLEKEGLMQFPAVMGGVVLAINVPGVQPGQMKLTPAVVADIYLGKIKKWNDPQIVALNKELKLPELAITVVHRSDGSGTTFIFTDYLSKVSPEWKDKVGENTSVSWPAGVGGKGNEGIASYVRQIKGAIGYVESAYSKQNNMTYTQLQNREGKFLEPTVETFKEAAAKAHWDKSNGFYEILTNEPGNNSWPITGATFVLLHKVQDKPENGKEVMKFFNWSFDNGDKLAGELDYIPLPASVKNLVRKTWKEEIKDPSGKALWN